VAAGGAIRVGELGNEEPRRRLTGAQPAPAKELTDADRQALARAEEKRARKRLKRALMNAKGCFWLSVSSSRRTSRRKSSKISNCW